VNFYRKGAKGAEGKGTESRKESTFAFSPPAGPGPDRGRGRQVRLCGEPDFEPADQKKSPKEEE